MSEKKEILKGINAKLMDGSVYRIKTTYGDAGYVIKNIFNNLIEDGFIMIRYKDKSFAVPLHQIAKIYEV